MKRRALSAPSLLCFALAALAACHAKGDSAVGEGGAEVSTPFESRFEGGSGALPSGWVVGTSNPPAGSDDAQWELLQDETAPSAPGALALVDARGHAAQAFNLCWLPRLTLADVDVSVAVRASGGIEDQGGGPAWRIGGVSDYYVARWNPLEDNFRVYSVVGGERLQLDSARVRVDAGSWHTIRVRHVGDSITCWFDGEELLHATDTKRTGAGAVGLWTKADATTRFDDFVVKSASAGG